VRIDVTAVPAETADLPVGLREVLGYWDRLRGDRWAPTWADFRLLDLPSSTIPFVIVLDVVPDPLDFIYRFWGTGNTTYIGYDCTGMSVRRNKLFSAKVFGECQQLVEKRRPIVWFSKVVRDDGLYREYTRLRVPLSDDGETVTHIVSAVRIEEKLDEIFTPVSG
jgi:hypothetical protein